MVVVAVVHRFWFRSVVVGWLRLMVVVLVVNTVVMEVFVL